VIGRHCKKVARRTSSESVYSKLVTQLVPR